MRNQSSLYKTTKALLKNFALVVISILISIGFSAIARADYGGLISNGDFESGHAYWYEGFYSSGTLSQSNTIITYDNTLAANGSWFAMLMSSGGTLGYQDVLASNDFILPGGTDSLLLNFDSEFSILQQSSCNAVNGTDLAYVNLYDATKGQTISTITINDANQTSYTPQTSYNNHSLIFGPGLSGYAGDSMYIFFSFVTNDPNCTQVLYLDNVSLHDSALTPVYRFYNFLDGSHFYTSNQAEATNVRDNLTYNYTYEDISYFTNTNQVPGTIPVYRFYDFLNGSHFYTANQAEATNVNNNMYTTYTYEGVAFYVYP